MCVRVCLPATGDILEEGAVAAWLAHTGDRVRKGQVIAQVETRLSAFDVESPVSGVLRILVRSEQMVAARTALAMVETDDSEEVEAVAVAVRDAVGAPAARAARADTGIRVAREPEVRSWRPAGGETPKSPLLSRLGSGSWNPDWA